GQTTKIIDGDEVERAVKFSVLKIIGDVERVDRKSSRTRDRQRIENLTGRLGGEAVEKRGSTGAGREARSRAVDARSEENPTGDIARFALKRCMDRQAAERHAGRVTTLGVGNQRVVNLVLQGGESRGALRRRRQARRLVGGTERRLNEKRIADRIAHCCAVRRLRNGQAIGSPIGRVKTGPVLK